MKIAIGCDHGGFVLKEAVVKAVTELGLEYEDFGTFDNASVDYPDYALKVALAVRDGGCGKGILLCGTGIGISIAANKVKGIRCAHVTDIFSAEMCAAHNDANIIAMGGRITSPADAYLFIKKFLSTPFEGGRHAARVGKISEIERKYL